MHSSYLNEKSKLEELPGHKYVPVMSHSYCQFAVLLICYDIKIVVFICKNARYI